MNAFLCQFSGYIFVILSSRVFFFPLSYYNFLNLFVPLYISKIIIVYMIITANDFPNLSFAFSLFEIPQPIYLRSVNSLL